MAEGTYDCHSWEHHPNTKPISRVSSSKPCGGFSHTSWSITLPWMTMVSHDSGMPLKQWDCHPHERGSGVQGKEFAQPLIPEAIRMTTTLSAYETTCRTHFYAKRTWQHQIIPAYRGAKEKNRSVCVLTQLVPRC